MTHFSSDCQDIIDLGSMTDGEAHELDPSSDLPVPPELDGNSPEEDETADDLDSWDDADNCNLFQSDENQACQASSKVVGENACDLFSGA